MSPWAARRSNPGDEAAQIREQPLGHESLGELGILAVEAQDDDPAERGPAGDTAEPERRGKKTKWPGKQAQDSAEKGKGENEEGRDQRKPGSRPDVCGADERGEEDHCGCSGQASAQAPNLMKGQMQATTLSGSSGWCGWKPRRLFRSGTNRVKLDLARSSPYSPQGCNGRCASGAAAKRITGDFESPLLESDRNPSPFIPSILSFRPVFEKVRTLLRDGQASTATDSIHRQNSRKNHIRGATVNETEPTGTKICHPA